MCVCARTTLKIIHNTCIMRKVCRVLYTELFYAIIPACFHTFCCSVIPTFLMFFTLVYLIFIAAYLMAFTLHTVHNFEFKVQSCSIRMCTYEENGVAHEAIVIEWAVSSAS